MSDTWQNWQALPAWLGHEIERAKRELKDAERIGELEEALHPFAELGGEIDPGRMWTKHWINPAVLVADIARAKRLLGGAAPPLPVARAGLCRFGR